MSTDQTTDQIIAWKNDGPAGDKDGASMSEDVKMQHVALESDGAEEEADDLPKTVTNNTGPLSNSRNVSIGSFDEAGAPSGVEEERKTVARLKKSSLCSTLSSGDHPYLSLISSEKDQQS